GLVSDRAGSVAIVLLTGDRSAISDNLYSDMRRSGLAHLLAISGLHVGLIAGLVFFGIRAVLALSPALALRYPIKKWAALAAIAAAFAYMLIVGATVPTQRAFLMTSLVLFAVLIDRLAISLRLVALAAAVVLLISPSSLTGPSFQMSFAAVLALVALYDGLRDRWGTWTAQPGLARRACLYLGGLMITSFTATLATAPFVLYHFQETPVYGPLANLVAVPLTASWIMPWGLAAYLLMPFGLETLALVPMGWGIDLLLELAHWFATQPGAVVATPALPTLAIVLVIAGGTWLALWRGKVRWFGFAGVPAAIMVAVLSPVPSILVSQDAGLIGLRLPDNTLAVSQMRRDSFTREQWARLTGADQVISWTDLAAADPGFRCDGQGCVWQRGTTTIAFVFDPAIAAEECALSIVVVSQEPIRRPCAAPILIDRFDVWRNGAYSLNVPIDAVTADEFVDLTTVRTVAEQTGHRPWSRSIQ
ncbi:MAG: ComEC/Rec2 family competence protein, partial [Pseudomonadota bacterium]